MLAAAPEGEACLKTAKILQKGETLMKNRLQNIAERYPLIFTTVIMILATILTEIHAEEWLKEYMDYQTACYLTGIVEQGAVSIFLVILISQLGLLKEAGFTRPSQWKQIWLVWPILVLSLLNGGTSPFDGTLTIDASRPLLIVLFVLLYLAVGFVEEILFRGVILTLLVQKWGRTRRGIYLAVIVSSVLFSLLHIINFIMGRYTLLAVLTQTGFALFFGVFFGACLLRTNSIWPIIFTHALFDACGNLEDNSVGAVFTRAHTTNPQGAITALLLTLPLLFYGLIILRKVKPHTSFLLDSHPDLARDNFNYPA